MGPSHFNSPCSGLIRISPTPCFQPFNSSPAKPLQLPVPVFSMQPYLGRALSLMTASPWRLSWSSVAKKWWRESGALPPSSTWGRQERKMEGCRDGVACRDQLGPSPPQWEADLCRWGTCLLPKSGKAFSPFSRCTRIPRRCVSSQMPLLKMALHLVMDLTIKQFWPVLTNHLNKLPDRRAAFLGHQNSTERNWRVIDIASFTFLRLTVL